jgi:hypothetical protein
VLLDMVQVLVLITGVLGIMVVVEVCGANKIIR